MSLVTHCIFSAPRPAYGVIAAAAISAAATVGTTMYAANQQKKAQKEAAAQQAGAAGGGLPQYELPPAPAFMPLDFANTNKGAVVNDIMAYKLSDADFKNRHGATVAAEKLFENQTLQDQKGESELMPAIQGEFMRAGLGSALDAFGDGAVLAPGSAGEASVARNLGMNIMGFQDRNRQNRQQSLKLAEELFPRRKFGLDGSDFAAITAANNMGLNNQNQANYANEVQASQFNYRVGAENQNATTAQNNANAQASAQAKAQQAQAMAGMVNSVLQSGASAYGAYSAGPGAASQPKGYMAAKYPAPTQSTSSSLYR